MRPCEVPEILHEMPINGKICLCGMMSEMVNSTISDVVQLGRHVWCGRSHYSWHHQMEAISALLAICAGNSPVTSPNKGQWRGALMFSLICTWINGWVNNREVGDLRCHCVHYEVTAILHNHIFFYPLWFTPIYWWLARLQYLQCINNGDAVDYH